MEKRAIRMSALAFDVVSVPKIAKMLKSAARPARPEQGGGKLVQRSDDNESVVRARLATYARQTKPLVDYYCRRPTFRSVDGLQTPERVAADLAAAIEAAGGSVRT